MRRHDSQGSSRIISILMLAAWIFGSAGVEAYVCPSETERAVAALINYERLRNGLTPLKIEVRLTEAARLHSQDMAVRDFFSHYTNPEVCDLNPDDPACIDPGVRIDWTGYDWWTYGENIAAGYPTPEEAVYGIEQPDGSRTGGWMNSPGHRANILNQNFRDIGVGYYAGSGTYYRYWNTDFATGLNPVRTPPECVPLRLGVFGGGGWQVDSSGNRAWEGPPSDRYFAFGLPTDRPMTGDWNGLGVTGLGAFRNGSWLLDLNGNGVWDGPALDRQFTFGLASDIPVAGDWNGDGRTKVGVFRAGRFILDLNGNGVWDGPAVDRQFTFGVAGDIPVAGDWNGDGIVEIGVYRSGKWYLDYNGNGVWDGCGSTWFKDRCYTFGLAGDIPVAGDWNGDGIVEIGVYRGGSWYLDYSGNGVWDGPAIDGKAAFGASTDKPVTGNW